MPMCRAWLEWHCHLISTHPPNQSLTQECRHLWRGVSCGTVSGQMCLRPATDPRARGRGPLHSAHIHVLSDRRWPQASRRLREGRNRTNGPFNAHGPEGKRARPHRRLPLADCQLSVVKRCSPGGRRASAFAQACLKCTAGSCTVVSALTPPHS